MIDRPEFKDKQQVEAPFLHYLRLYEAQDPAEIAARTGLTFTDGASGQGGNFALTFVGTRYRVNHPDFLVFEDNDKDGAAPPIVLRNPYEEILLIHYLTEGVFVPPTGEMIDYRQFQGGSLYHSKFKQRAIDRLAREFGANPSVLPDAAMRVPGLRSQAAASSGAHGTPGTRETLGVSGTSGGFGSSGADAGITVEFLPELWVRLLVWAADDEFPASAQILFSDNFPKAFTAEDTAGVCDILISRLKKYI
jgi:hypothetical protein